MSLSQDLKPFEARIYVEAMLNKVKLGVKFEDTLFLFRNYSIILHRKTI